MRWLLVPILFAGGCIYDELLATHVEPGGTVTSTLEGGMPRTSTGLGDVTKDPFSLNGFSAFLTFGLVAPGGTQATLAMNNSSIEVDVIPGGAPQLEIHSDGSGCTAQSAVIHLHTDNSGNLSGDFNATGVVPNSTDTCAFSGTLNGIPITR